MLKEIGAEHIPVLTVWNKIDMVPSRPLVSRQNYLDPFYTQGGISMEKKVCLCLCSSRALQKEETL